MASHVALAVSLCVCVCGPACPSTSTSDVLLPSGSLPRAVLATSRQPYKLNHTLGHSQAHHAT